MTYKVNNIVNIDVVATQNLTLFNGNLYTIMNITVNPLTTTVSGLPTITVASGSNGQKIGTYTVEVASTSGFSGGPSSIYVQDSAAGIANIEYTSVDSTDFFQCTGDGGTIVTGYGVTTSGNIAVIDSGSGGQTLPQSTIFISGVGLNTLPSSGNIYIWTQSSSSGQVVAYTSYTFNGTDYTFSGCSGGTTQLTTGDLVFFEPYTTVASGSNGLVLGTFTLDVNTTTGVPSSGEIFLDGAVITYTSVTGGGTPSFNGCNTGSQTIVYTGDSVFLSAFSPLPVVSTTGFPSSGSLFNGGVSYTGTTSNSFTGVTGGSGTEIKNGTPVPLYTNSYWLGFPKGVPFTMALRNTLGSGINPFLTSASGNAASLISSETTIASGSNGQTLPQSIIYVASTTYYPPSGSIFITDSNGTELITYTSITGGATPSFNGCTGGTGTLSTGDTVYPENYNAVLTGLNNVTGIEQTYVAIGNAKYTGNNVGLNGGTVQAFFGSTAIGVAVSGTLPDTNNGSLIWALTDYVYNGTANVLASGSPDQGNTVFYFLSDGYNIRLAQPFQQSYWQSENVQVNDGFNSPFSPNGNLGAFNLVAGSLTGPFSVGLGTSTFVTVIENSTSYPATVGYSTNYTYITSNSIIIPSGEAYYFFGDGTTIFSPNVNPATIVPINVTNSSGGSPHQITESSGSSYIVNAAGGVTVNLPYMPANGTRYTFTDDNNTFSYNNPFGLNASSSSYGQDYFINAFSGVFPSGFVSNCGFTNSGISFTIEYSTTTSGDIGIWGVSGSNTETTINNGNTPYTINTPSPDVNGTTYIIDASSSTISITLPATPANGTQFTFKDANFTWSINQTVTINAGGSDTIQMSSNSSSSSVTYSIPNQSFTLIYNSSTSVWSIVGVWRVISSNKPQLGVITLNFSNTSGSYTSSDYYKESDYFIDTTGGTIEVTIDNGIIAKDGQTLSFKDPSNSWATNNFTLLSNNASIEYPKGTINSPFNPITFNINYTFVQFRYYLIGNTWVLISTL